MLKFDNLSAANILAQNTACDRDRLLVQLLTTMTERIVQLEQQVNEFGQWRNNADHTAIRLNELETRLDSLGSNVPATFDEKVLEVLDVRSGSARAALGLEDTDVQRWMLSAIEENSGEAFGHIEAEIDDKMMEFTESNCFHESVAESVQGSLHGIVEEILDGILADAITDHLGDAEDIVRKGLRSIL